LPFKTQSLNFFAAVLDCCLTKKKEDMKIQKRLLIEVPKTKDAAAVHNDKKTNFEMATPSELFR